MTDTAAPLTMHLAETWDGLYAPLGVLLPDGEGPFPMVLLAHGNGGGGKAWIRDAVANRGYLLERLVERGYACAWMRYRAEVDQGYANGPPLQRSWHAGGDLFNRAPLEYEDTIAIAEYVKNLPRIDADRVAFVGVSHGGEMLLKMAAEYDGFAVGVAAEPAAHEFLGVDGSVVRAVKQRGDERGAAPLSSNDVGVVLAAMGGELLAQRLAAVQTPMLVMGRESDDLQAVFRATYEVLEQAGKEVRWTSYAHDLHGYIFPIRGSDGAYEVAPVQLEAIAELLEYLDDHLRS